jgi:uncharacterized protein YjbI with pentapeptide repeats
MTSEGSSQAAVVGNGNDYVAQSTSGNLIGQAVGLVGETGITSETDVCTGPAPFCTSGGAGANAYSIQVNSNGGCGYSCGFPVVFNGNPTTGWEQFVFSNEPSGFEGLWIEFWLYDYSNLYLGGGSCSSLPIPSGASGTWYGPDGSGDCYLNTNATPTPFVPASSLGGVSMGGYANCGSISVCGSGNDMAQVCIPGSGCYYNVEPGFLNLYQQWKVAEINVVGFISGSRAEFNTGTSITIDDYIYDDTGTPIHSVTPCANNGQTGETNNLNLLGCTSSYPSYSAQFTESTFGFSISAQTDATVLAGDTASIPVKLTLSSAPADSVSLSVSGLPPGATYSFTTNPITPTSGGATTTLNVVTASGALGDGTLTITGADGALTQSATVNLHIYDFSVGVTPTDSTVLRGGTATYAVTLTLLSGSSTTGIPAILLSTSGLPADATQNPLASVTPTTSGVTEDLHVTSSAAPGGSLGDFAFSVAGTAPSGSDRSTPANLHIYDFSVSLSPDQTVLRGESGAYNVTLKLVPHSSTTGIPTLSLSASGIPGDASASFSPSGVSPSAGGSISTLTLSTGSSSLGDFTFTVTGSDTRPALGGLRTGTGGLHIYDFTVELSPASVTIPRGASTSYTVTLTLAPGSSAPPAISLTTSGMPSGSTSGLSTNTVTPTLAGATSTLTVNTFVASPGPTTLGDFTPTVQGTDNVDLSGGSRSGSTGLHIFDYSVSLSPSTATLFSGSSTTMTVNVGLVPGSTTAGLPAVSTLLSGLPSGVTATGFPASLIPGTSQGFTLSAGSSSGYISCPRVSSTGGQNLKGADLANCNLAGYSLKGDNLQGANLMFADLQNVNFQGANLQNANLASAFTMGANFQGANMAGADVSSASSIMTGTFTITATGTVDGQSRSGTASLTVYGDDFSGADFQGVNLSNANFANDLATNANFQGANLRASNLSGGDFQGSNFQGVNMKDSNMSNGDFNSCNFQGANTQGANITGATFVGATDAP